MTKKNLNLPVRRYILMTLLFVLVCTGACFTSPSKTYAKTLKVKSATDWHNISKYKGGTFKLTRNIKLSKPAQYLTITKNKKYTIDLNGYKVYTTYAQKELRAYCPLTIEKGTVILKSSKKNKGVLYSTETAAVTVGNKAVFYLKSGMIVNDAVEFRSNMPTGIYLANHAKCYIQGASKVQSIGNAIAMFDYSSLFLTGHPLIRAGASNIKGQFTHYGSGINITSPSCKVSLKGGTIGTMASPPAVVNNFLGAYEFQQSGDFPIYDKNGKTLKAAKGYKFVDAKKNDVPITSSFDSFGPNAAYYLALSGASPDKRLTTTVTSSDGYYSIYIVKK